MFYVRSGHRIVLFGSTNVYFHGMSTPYLPHSLASLAIWPRLAADDRSPAPQCVRQELRGIDGLPWTEDSKVAVAVNNNSI